MTGTLFRTSTNALLNDLGWTRLETRRLIHKILFFHRLYYNSPSLPLYLTDILPDLRRDATGLRLRNAELLSNTQTRTVSLYRSYIPATTRQWNLLPESLSTTSSYPDFARQVWQRFGVREPHAMHSVEPKHLNTIHTQLRVGLSPLNAHLFLIRHKHTSPECICGHNKEGTKITTYSAVHCTLTKGSNSLMTSQRPFPTSTHSILNKNLTPYYMDTISSSTRESKLHITYITYTNTFTTPVASATSTGAYYTLRHMHRTK